MTNKGFKTEYLGSGISVVVTDEHTFGTDALLLSHFACVKGRDNPMDMGTGCGIIPLLWCTREKPDIINCIDIQENAVNQLKQSIEISSLEQRLFVKHCDLKNVRENFSAGEFSVVTMNPPYKPLDTGIESLQDSVRIARHEVMCTIDDVLEAASYLLKYGGRFCMCHRPERMADVIVSFRNHGIEPKRIRLVSDKMGEEPFLLLIDGRKGGKPSLRVEPHLYIKNSDGKFSKEMFEIYGEYGQGYHQ